MGDVADLEALDGVGGRGGGGNNDISALDRSCPRVKACAAAIVESLWATEASKCSRCTLQADDVDLRRWGLDRTLVLWLRRFSGARYRSNRCIWTCMIAQSRTREL